MLKQPLRSIESDGSGTDAQEDGLKVPASAFWMVCLTVFIDSLGGSISAPVLPFYAKEFHVSDDMVGVLFSTFSVAQVIFLPVFGRMSDRFGRRRVLIASLFGAAMGAWAQGAATSFWLLAAARVVSGACGAVGSTANVYVSDITTDGVRGQYLGYLMSSNGAAFAFGPGLGGGLSRLGLNVPILVNSALCLVAGFLAVVYLPESPVFVRQQREAAEASIVGRDAGAKSLRRVSVAVWAVCAVEVLRGFTFSAIFAMYGLFALQVYDLDSLHIGYAVCIGALTLICTNVWLTCPLQCVCGQVVCAAIGLAMMACGEIALAFAPTLSLSLVGMWFVYMGQAVAGCTIAAITSNLSTDENRGQVMSMQQMAQAVGRVIGPVLLGRLMNSDVRLPFAVAAFAALLASLILLSLRKSYEHHIAGIPNLPSPCPSPPAWANESYTDEDETELGSFLCKLLTDRHYRWKEPEQKEALKKALRICFPPLLSEANGFDSADSRMVLDIRQRAETQRADLMPSGLAVGFSLRQATAAAASQGFTASPLVDTRRRCFSTSAT